MAKLTAAEIRKLIKAHNVLTKITIPKGAKRDDLIKLVEKKGYKVDHENKKISRSVGKSTETITLKGAEIIGKPKEKTALQKQKAAEKKEEKAVAQKKKERELKKEAVKKATKDMVPKTKPPKKIGAKPVPQKKEKKKYPTEGVKKVGEAIKKRKEEAAKKKAQAKAPAPTPKTTVSKKPRRQLKETKKPTGTAVVQPGKPENLQIKKKEEPKKKKKEEPKKKQKAEPRIKGGLISMIMEAEGEAKTILENILKKYNSLTAEEKEKNRKALDNTLFDKVIYYQRVDSGGNVTGGGIKSLKEVQKKINDMGSEKKEDFEEKKRKALEIMAQMKEKEEKPKRQLLKQLQDKWENNFRNKYQWTKEQIDRIEQILFEKDGIKATGAESVDDPVGFKLFFSVDGKTKSTYMMKLPKLGKPKN